MPLLDNAALERSSIVANSRMNRQRTAEGVNSYQRELGFSPVAFLAARIAAGRSVAWLDLCCGEGRAVLDAAERLRPTFPNATMSFHGVDLVDMFDARCSRNAVVQLEAASLHDWQTAEQFDLVTCVHGLHYIGDKLGLVERAAAWLKDDGLFAASLDLANVQSAGKEPLARGVARRLRACGFTYDARRRLLTRCGRAEVRLGYDYIGADDAAGPNYSGQEAVNSRYEHRG